MAKRLTPEEMRAALQAQMQQHAQLKSATGTGNPMPTSAPGDVDGRAIIRLKVADVGIYERNPRTVPNAKRQEILESILARGLDQQLTVTKRPGTDRYVLAKGGNTRLSILQELALTYPERFAQQDFNLVEYVAESDVLIGHMVENLSRSDMSFWDTAHSFLELRGMRSQELGRDLSASSFAKDLHSRGLKLDRNLLQEYEFLVSRLSPLGAAGHNLGRNDILRTLRPQFTAIDDVRSKLQITVQPDLNRAYAQWVTEFAQIASDPHEFNDPDEDSSGSDEEQAEGAHPQRIAASPAPALESHIHACAAQWLGLEPAELAILLQAVMSDRSISGEALLAALSEPVTTGETGTGQVGDSTPFLATSSGETGGSGETDTDDRDVWTRHNNPMPGPETADRPISIPGRQANVPDALKGITTAPEHLLTRGGGPGQTPSTSTSTSPSTETGQQGGQAQLPGTSSLEHARAALSDALMGMADFASVGACVVGCDQLPYGFYVETPAVPVGASPNDFAVQTWWFLATISGQLSPQWFVAVPDSGPTGFMARANDEVGWIEFVRTHLGGEFQDHGFYVLELLSDTSNPVADYARDVLKALAAVRQMALDAAQVSAQGGDQ